ncbi:MAG: AAA family ATPase [Anaerotignum propionicum]|uniref:AAA family ATPase n=1 Tax=Anaerotignum propionicum TaxID=28446 RepID=UPI002B1FBD8D|nr:AAA family ATPase [Anaerotignum propionicum]MEA5057714.1 AAA family ATPase [Anaerotignum propionicum]
MSNNLIIQKVKIENFRSYKFFIQEFGDKPVVLITGPNGYGKTTLIDAIEWGLTGDIRRISNSYKKRNTTQSEKERAENLKGQIKNRESTSDEMIRLEIFFKCNDIEFSVWREQVVDNLLEKSDLNFSEDVSEGLIKDIEGLSNENFYPYFVCDNNKAYDFLRTPRRCFRII